MYGVALLEGLLHGKNGDQSHLVLALQDHEAVAAFDFAAWEHGYALPGHLFSVRNGLYWQAPKAEVKKFARFMAHLLNTKGKFEIPAQVTEAPEDGASAGFQDVATPKVTLVEYDCVTALAHVLKIAGIGSPFLDVASLTNEQQVADAVAALDLSEGADWQEIAGTGLVLRAGANAVPYAEVKEALKLRFSNGLPQVFPCHTP